MSKAQQCFQVDSNKFWLLVLVRKCQLLQNSLTCSFKYLLGNYRNTLKCSICRIFKYTNAKCLHRNSNFFFSLDEFLSKGE